MITLGTLRSALGISQPELVERIHALGYRDFLDQAKLSKYESGRHPVPTRLLVIWAAALHVDVENVIRSGTAKADEPDLQAQPNEPGLQAQPA